MENKNTISILEKIISRGGLMAAYASMYIGNEEKASQFIRECSAQCHNDYTFQIWGTDLIAEIKKYSNAVPSESFRKNLGQKKIKIGRKEFLSV